MADKNQLDVWKSKLNECEAALMSEVKELIDKDFGNSHPISILGQLVEENTNGMIVKIDNYIDMVNNSKNFNTNQKMERVFRAISLKELITGKSKESIELLNYDNKRESPRF